MDFKTITFILNGRERTCSIDVRMSLTELLREEFGLTSVKTGCEVGGIRLFSLHFFKFFLSVLSLCTQFSCGCLFDFRININHEVAEYD